MNRTAYYPWSSFPSPFPPCKIKGAISRCSTIDQLPPFRPNLYDRVESCLRRYYSNKSWYIFGQNFCTLKEVNQMKRKIARTTSNSSTRIKEYCLDYGPNPPQWVSILGRRFPGCREGDSPFKPFWICLLLKCEFHSFLFIYLLPLVGLSVWCSISIAATPASNR
jgi:hypothetical protein